MQRCDTCKNLRKLFGATCGTCDEETRDPGDSAGALKVKYESYLKIKYTTKNGTEKDRKDFVSLQLPFSEFKERLTDYWPKFIQHHINDAKWHDDDFIGLKKNLRRVQSSCGNAIYAGPPTELQIRCENVAAASAERTNRATVIRDALARAKSAVVGDVICIETHMDKQSHSWVLGKVVEGLHDATTASQPYDATKDAVHLEEIKLREPTLKVNLCEALDAASTAYFLSSIVVCVPGRSVRVIAVKLEEARASARVQA
ncbi:MAG: hypothetical protein SGPRY_014391, partial [Prymnesium sp.]